MKSIPKLLVYTASLALIVLPSLMEYFRGLWAREMYQFFPIAIVATVGLVATRLGKPLFATVWGLTCRMGLATMGLGMLAFGVSANSPWLCYVGFIALVGVGLMCFKDRDGTRSLFYLLLPLLLTVRPPLNLDVRAVQKLQQLTSIRASAVLNIVGMDHIRSGNVIEPLGQSPLMVAEACSGVQSLFTLLFLASMIAVSGRYKLVRSSILLSLAAFWSGVMNTARVVSIIVAKSWYNVDLAEGTPHEILGYVVLIAAAVMLLSSDQLLYFFISPISSSAKHRVQNPLVSFWNWMTIHPQVNQPDPAGKEILLGLCVVISLFIMMPKYLGLTDDNPREVDSVLSFFDQRHQLLVADGWSQNSGDSV